MNSLTHQSCFICPVENVLFSLQNLRARSNKDAKDQTTKNSLESEFSVPKPLHAPVVAAAASRQEQPGRPAGSHSGPSAAPDFQ